MFEDLASLVVGLALVVYAVVNAGGQVTRRLVKRLGAILFRGSAICEFIDHFADSRFGRTFYGAIVTIFAFFIGVGWVIISINLLVGDFRRLK